MTTIYESRLAAYQLTDGQYRRAVAAHELAHGLVAIAAPSRDVHSVELIDHPQQGVQGRAVTTVARGYEKADPEDHAVGLYAGAIAKARWLQEREGRWSSDLARLVDECAAGDHAIIGRLGLGRRELDRAQRDSLRAVERQWSGLIKGVPKLVKRGRLTGRELHRLAR